MFKRPTTARGASLFGDGPSPPKQPAAAYRANIDGGARGNPGPAAYGVVIRDPHGAVIARLKKYIGRATNNVAEYYGLIAALDYAQAHGIRALCVEGDSELLVKQMRGQYKVKSPELRPLFERARKMAQGFQSFRIDHVYRERNAEADALVNAALDETSGATSGNSRGRNPTSDGASGETRRLRARFRNGALHPVEPLDLPEGAEVEIQIRTPRKP
jgi:ribonuclease HI